MRLVFGKVLPLASVARPRTRSAASLVTGMLVTSSLRALQVGWVSHSSPLILTISLVTERRSKRTQLSVPIKSLGLLLANYLEHSSIKIFRLVTAEVGGEGDLLYHLDTILRAWPYSFQHNSLHSIFLCNWCILREKKKMISASLRGSPNDFPVKSWRQRPYRRSYEAMLRDSERYWDMNHHISNA